MKKIKLKVSFLFFSSFHPQIFNQMHEKKNKKKKILETNKCLSLFFETA